MLTPRLAPSTTTTERNNERLALTVQPSKEQTAKIPRILHAIVFSMLIIGLFTTSLCVNVLCVHTIAGWLAPLNTTHGQAKSRPNKVSNTAPVVQKLGVSHAAVIVFNTRPLHQTATHPVSQEEATRSSLVTARFVAAPVSVCATQSCALQSHLSLRAKVHPLGGVFFCDMNCMSDGVCCSATALCVARCAD